MSKTKISVEIVKYPYCGELMESKEFLSEKICCWTIKVRKKMVKRAKWFLMYGDFVICLTNGVPPARAIGLPIPIQTPTIMKSMDSTASLSKEAIIIQVIKAMPTDIDFTQKELDELYHLSVEYKNNSLSQEELITKIKNLRGGSFVEVGISLVIVASIIILLANSAIGFQPNPNAIIPPHLQWLYGNQQPGNDFGYSNKPGSRSHTGLAVETQNAGSDKKDPSSGSYSYVEMMNRLEEQSRKTTIEIQVGDQIYSFTNPNRQNADKLQFKLAEKIYDSIRESDTDICDIAENLGFKADNIKKVKDHIFNNEHTLDRYPSEEIEHRRFDATLEQALAWKRLEAGIHTQEDITWIKHECAERHHELKYNSGYSEAHDRAESLYKGYPWENPF